MTATAYTDWYTLHSVVGFLASCDSRDPLRDPLSPRKAGFPLPGLGALKLSLYVTELHRARL